MISELANTLHSRFQNNKTAMIMELAPIATANFPQPGSFAESVFVLNRLWEGEELEYLPQSFYGALQASLK